MQNSYLIAYGKMARLQKAANHTKSDFEMRKYRGSVLYLSGLYQNKYVSRNDTSMYFIILLFHVFVNFVAGMSCLEKIGKLW